MSDATEVSAGKSGVRVVSYFALSVALLLCAAVPASTPAAPGVFLGFLVAVLVLEMTAPGLPQKGFSSPAHACYLAAAILPGVGPSAAALVVALGITTRTLLRGSPVPFDRMREATVDLFPASVAIGCVAFLGRSGVPVEAAALLAAMASAFVLLLVPATVMEEGGGELERWRGARRRLLVLVFAYPAAGLLLALVTTSLPWSGLFMLPLLLGLNVAVRLAGQQEALADQKALAASLESLQSQHADVRESAACLSDQLRQAHEERMVLDDFGRALARIQTVDRVIERVLDIMQRLVPYRTAAVFLNFGASLQLVSCRGREPMETVAEWHSGQSRTIVHAAWRHETAVSTTSDMLQYDSLRAGTSHSVAVVMEKVGVIFLEDDGLRGYADDQVRLISLLANHAGLAVASVGHLQAQTEAMRLYEEANAELHRWLGLLRTILDGSRTVAARLEPRELLVRLQPVLQSLAPHDVGLVHVWPATEEGRAVSSSWGSLAAGALDVDSRAGLLGLLRRAGSTPTVLDAAESVELREALPELGSVLLAPLWTEDDVVGAVLLGGGRGTGFTTEQRDVVGLLSLQVAAAVRNAQLHQALIESQAQLVQSSKLAAVGQLAAGVAHEINSPLAAVLIAVEAAIDLMPRDIGVAAKRLEKGKKAALKARTIIQNLLFYARGRTDVTETFEVSRVVQDAVDFIGNQIRLDNIELETELRSARTVTGNRNELQQVLTNLLINARDSLASVPEERARVIRVRTRDAGDGCGVDVVDTGPGVLPDLMERIFDPFFTTKPVGKGTGLGLSISQQIVRQHRGTISVKSEPGETVFSILLPSGEESGSV